MYHLSGLATALLNNPTILSEHTRKSVLLAMSAQHPLVPSV